jgi:hypothetical protein
MLDLHSTAPAIIDAIDVATARRIIAHIAVCTVIGQTNEPEHIGFPRLGETSLDSKPFRAQM